MRLATYNVENLFTRPKVMNQDTWDDGKRVLNAYSTLSKLLGQQTYSAATKGKIVEQLKALKLTRNDTSQFVLLRRSRGSLLRRPKSGGVQITADGRDDWIGSLELRPEQIRERPILNTARVIADVNADVLGVVETDSRPGLKMFNDNILPRVGEAFQHVMLIDGNDRRGIDVGLLTKQDFPIGYMKSHVDDIGSNGKHTFSRDCPEFDVEMGDATVLVMVNHLKSKGYGGPAASNRRRKNQASRIAEIYNQRRKDGYDYIAILGDLNDTPTSAPLKPLIQDTDLRDISEHPTFDDGGYPGTYGYCSASHKIDFVLLSPALFDNVIGGGIHRAGMWPGVRPAPRWPKMNQIRTKADVASDHALLWADIDESAL